MTLDVSAHLRYFCKCVRYRPQRPKFLGHFGPPNKSKLRFSTILPKKYSGLMSVLLYVLVEATFRDVYNMCLRGPIFVPFLVPKEVKILVFGHFLKKFSLVSHQYCFTCSLQVLLELGVWNVRLRGPNFWAILGLEMI